MNPTGLRCVDGQIRVREPTVSGFYRHPMNQRQLEDVFTNQQIPGQTPLDSAMPEGRFYKITQAKGRKLQATYNPVVLDRGERRLVNWSLSRQAEDLRNKNPKVFAKKCGNKFVASELFGADLFLDIQLTSRHLETCKDALNSHLVYRHLWYDLEKIAAAYKEGLIAKRCRGLQFQVTVLQRGGLIKQLPRTESEKYLRFKNRILKVVQCNERNFETCVRFSKELIPYANNEFLKQISRPYLLNVSGGSAPLSQSLLPYETER